MNKKYVVIRRPGKPPRLCIYPKCPVTMEPGNWMCPKHWALVPSPERRALLREVTRLRTLGQKKPSAELIELVGLVRRAAMLTEAKSEVAVTISDALDRPLRSTALKDALFKEVEQDPEPPAQARGTFSVHKKPGTFDDCGYLAETACTECGWVREVST